MNLWTHRLAGDGALVPVRRRSAAHSAAAGDAHSAAAWEQRRPAVSMRLIGVRSPPAAASEPPPDRRHLSRHDGASDADERGDAPDALLDRKPEDVREDHLRPTFTSVDSAWGSPSRADRSVVEERDGGPGLLGPALGLLPIFLAAEGGQVEDAVGAAERLSSASVCRVGVEDVFAFS
jgi:hypothetical protein